MSNETNKNSSNSDNVCVLCFKNVGIYSIGVCDHAVCYECSTRMRVLCNQNECPICRANISCVYFVKEIKPFQELEQMRHYGSDEKYGIKFLSEDVKIAYDAILEHICSVCLEDFRTFADLKKHMKQAHEMFYCSLCVENIKIFSSERRAYNRVDLARHRIRGDSDNTSHKGHPLCEFCDTRFMDSDDLYRHLRRTHLYCHLCDADGGNLYFKSIDDLKKHFSDEHYLCEEGDCKTCPMTAVFRSKLDLQAHFATIHSKFLSKSAVKQARTLELKFSLVPRNRRENTATRREFESSVQASSNIENESSDRTFVRPLTSEDFPALGNNNNPVPLRPKHAYSARENTNYKREDFPSLGGSSSVGSKKPECTKQTTGFPPLGQPSTSKESSVQLSVNQNANAAKVSIKVTNGQSVHTKISTKNLRPANDPFPALDSNITLGEAQWVNVKNKKKEEKPPAKKTENLNPNQFPDLKKKSKGESAMVNLNKASSKSKLNNTYSQKAGKKQSNHTENVDENSNRKQKSKPQKSVETKNEITVNSNDTTTTTITNRVNPPPGFNRPPPPPGFLGSERDFPSLGIQQRVSDVTFTTSNGQSYSISPCNDYKPPSNFSFRNQNIFKRLLMVCSPEGLSEFKIFSEKFRNDKITSEKYYEHCQKFLGVNFDEFFPELLVLLPNVTKQQELYKVCNNKSRKMLVKCERCGQIVFKKELVDHYKYHTLEL